MPFVQALAAPAGVFIESTLDDPAGAEDVVREPSLRDVEEAVRRLDGATFCQVTLSGGRAGEYLLVEGGPESYRVTIVGDEAEDDFAIAINPERFPPSRRFQVGDWVDEDAPGRYLLGLEAALSCALTYADTGELAPAFDWNFQ